jgi:hypothetical protein
VSENIDDVVKVARVDIIKNPEWQLRIPVIVTADSGRS